MNIFYHNPRCSKSRKGLEYLQKSQVDFKIKEYLKEPVEKSEILEIFEKLKVSNEKLIRKGETLFKELDIDESGMDAESWADLLAKHPSLIERPIFVTDNIAVIGRPPEALLKII